MSSSDSTVCAAPSVSSSFLVHHHHHLTNVKDHLRLMFSFFSFCEGLSVAKTCRSWYAAFTSFKQPVPLTMSQFHDKVLIQPQLLNAWFLPWCNDLEWDDEGTKESRNIVAIIASQIHALRSFQTLAVAFPAAGFMNLRHLELLVHSDTGPIPHAIQLLSWYSSQQPSQLQTISLELDCYSVEALIKVNEVLSPELRQIVTLSTFYRPLSLTVFNWLRIHWPLAHKTILTKAVIDFPSWTNWHSFSDIWQDLLKSDRALLTAFRWKKDSFKSVLDAIEFLQDCTSLSGLWIYGVDDETILPVMSQCTDVLSSLQSMHIGRSHSNFKWDWSKLSNLSYLELCDAVIDYEDLMLCLGSLPRLKHIRLTLNHSPFPCDVEDGNDLLLTRFPQLQMCDYVLWD